MDAIYVLAGENREGPFTRQEITDLIKQGRFSVNSLAWHEGLPDWKPLDELLSDSPQQSEEDSGPIVAEGENYTVTQKDMIIGGEIFSLSGVLQATVEVERVKRGWPIFWSIFFGILACIAAALPFTLPIIITGNAAWFSWGFALLFLLLCLRNLLTATEAGGTIFTVHLTNGDDRILRLPKNEAINLANLINRLAKEASQPSE